jgi:hypothetical protein
VLNQFGRFFERLDLWADLARLDFKTTVEMPEPSRSDCHAWGAHPRYHAVAGLLGIRPAAFGFRKVRIAPQLGPLTCARGRVPHPRGEIVADLKREDDRIAGTIELPPGVEGEFVWNNIRRPLPPGLTIL